ncbi:MAG: GNAT family N-acetyltransferase [Armatimonadia bacterium]|nr:GNAT family N-acetyltransferase [Armatimonadia bacterium]
MDGKAAIDCQVRPAGLDDADGITRLAWDLLRFHAELSPEWTRPLDGYDAFHEVWHPYLYGFISGTGSEAMVATVGDRLVGYLLLALRDRPPIFQGPPDLVVAEVMVIPELRGAGVGARLMAAGYDWGAEKGAGYARLHVYEHNAGALRFYEREGFISHERVLLRKLDGPADG